MSERNSMIKQTRVSYLGPSKRQLISRTESLRWSFLWNNNLKTASGQSIGQLKKTHTLMLSKMPNPTLKAARVIPLCQKGVKKLETVQAIACRLRQRTLQYTRYILNLLNHQL
ncbi:hypothetical protein M514_03378 [Trichuris suis]|uniref:Uncharacterized protein n=1 Tax=Trichuris suis TaxID=68888 RepID=A0A085MEI4_9BILA|nr:hypothetical protein M513_03378 [Trichuris suis]KFD68042.1 hypothetical protein M514_03378 [Trichuris suis]